MRRKCKRKTSVAIKLILSSCFVFVFMNACKQDFDGHYDPPKGYEGPIYEKLKSDPDFSTFVSAIEMVPELSRIVNTSGLYTVFAPTNEAFNAYFKANPTRNSLKDFDVNNADDIDELSRLVNYHFIFNMYYAYEFNLRVDLENENSVDDISFKTRSRKGNYTYFDEYVNKNRTIRTDAYEVQVYMDSYIQKHGIENDYEAIYGVAPGVFNVEGAQVISDKSEIDAENGAIHGINKVLEPLPLIDDVIAELSPTMNKLMKEFVHLNYDHANTMAENTDKLHVDSLFKKSQTWQPNLAQPENLYSFIIPDEQAFSAYFNEEILPGFDHFDSIPEMTLGYLVNNQCFNKKVYPKEFELGETNISADTISNVVPNSLNIIPCANGLVYHQTNYEVPRVYRSVAKVALTHQKYSLYARILSMTKANLNGNEDMLTALKDLNSEFTMFVPTNEALNRAGIVYRKDKKGVYQLYNGDLKMNRFAADSLVNYHTLNTAYAQSELVNGFYRTRNYTYVEMIDGKVKGNPATNILDLLPYEPNENGYVYGIDFLLRPPSSSVGTILNSFYNKAKYEELAKALAAQDMLAMLEDAESGEYYTILAPSNAAMIAFSNADPVNYPVDYSGDNWKMVLEHMIINEIVFTDGTNIDPVGNNTLLQTVDGPQKVTIVSNAGILEVSNSTNTSTVLTSGEVDVQGVNGAIHSVDQILLPN